MAFGGFRLRTLNFSAFGRGLSLRRLVENYQVCGETTFLHRRAGTFIEAAHP